MKKSHLNHPMRRALLRLRTWMWLPLLAGLFACEQSDPPVLTQTLVWADEFNGTELDESKWEVMTGDGTEFGIPGWGNNEAQYYRAENASVGNGVLRIAAVRQDFGGYEYTSARLRSQGRGDFKYGRMEASIRTDPTQGLWHAFWMLPTNPVNPWPISGEIDIMEYVGNLSDITLTTIHYADAQGNHQELGSTQPFQQDNAFHLYAVEWDEFEITWFRDSVEVFSVNRNNDLIAQTWPFDAEFHLILNTAVGGNLGGNINSGALAAPKYMDVDYVRVYQNQ